MTTKPHEEFLLLILSSPSGAGKTTLTRRLQDEFPELRFSVSHTTRPARLNEVDGRDYHFIDRAKFEAKIAAGDFLEWAQVHGNLYGTAISEITHAKAHPGCHGMIFDIDYQGARQIRAKEPQVVSVFILPPSMEELLRRLKGRASESEDVVNKRFAAAEKEIQHYAFFDYLIVNDKLEDAFRQLCSVILAERARRWRQAGLAEVLLRDGTLMRSAGKV
jgi:guanylate kinase